MSNANLSHADLSACDLSEANLQGSNLSHANLQGANLTQADLLGADLEFIRLDKQTILIGAKISDCIRTRCVIEDAIPPELREGIQWV